MKSRITKEFRELLSKLPEAVQRQARDAYALVRCDPFHPSLHFKQVTETHPAYTSVRIGRRYRAMGLRESDSILWVWIGSHAEYDRRIRR